ncbi:MAG: hypothetical protein ACPGEF_01165 [Endozoicomonas sp.]
MKLSREGTDITKNAIRSGSHPMLEKPKRVIYYRRHRDKKQGIQECLLAKIPLFTQSNELLKLKVAACEDLINKLSRKYARKIRREMRQSRKNNEGYRRNVPSIPIGFQVATRRQESESPLAYK